MRLRTSFGFMAASAMPWKRDTAQTMRKMLAEEVSELGTEHPSNKQPSQEHVTEHTWAARAFEP
jgi:hypothetical protein